MPVSPIGSGAPATRAVTPAQPSLPSLPETSTVNGEKGFGDVLGAVLDNLQATQTKADTLSVAAATGQLADVHDYMIAATEASLAMEMTVAVRNRAVDAFNQIMQMGV